jgi:hypothetical protein
VAIIGLRRGWQEETGGPAGCAIRPWRIAGNP